MSHDRFAMADLTGGETNAIIKMVGGAEGARAILRGEKTLKVESVASKKILAGLLEEVGEPIRFSSVKRFVARDKLKVDVNGELPIWNLGENLMANFGDLIEENVPAMTVKQRKLLNSSSDENILVALGDKDFPKVKRARVYFAHVFEFLKTAYHSKWFIFYIADAKGTVWAVHAYWGADDSGWYVEADSVTLPDRWDADDQVVSR